MVVNIESLVAMARDLLSEADSIFDYILTYKLSQDHLELFFNAVRRLGELIYIRHNLISFFICFQVGHKLCILLLNREWGVTPSRMCQLLKN